MYLKIYFYVNSWYTALLIKYSTRHNYLHFTFLNCLGTSLFFALFSVLVPYNLADQLDIDKIHTSEKYNYDFLKNQLFKYLNNYFSHVLFLFFLSKKKKFWLIKFYKNRCCVS